MKIIPPLIAKCRTKVPGQQYLSLATQSLVIKRNIYLIKNDHTETAISLKAATRGVLLKKMFLEISQNSQEDTCARVPGRLLLYCM